MFGLRCFDFAGVTVRREGFGSYRTCFAQHDMPPLMSSCAQETDRPCDASRTECSPGTCVPTLIWREERGRRNQGGVQSHCPSRRKELPSQSPNSDVWNGTCGSNLNFHQPGCPHPGCHPAGFLPSDELWPAAPAAWTWSRALKNGLLHARPVSAINGPSV